MLSSVQLLIRISSKLSRLPTSTFEGIQFQYGFNSKTLKKVVDYWLNEYKWREREVYLNKYPHYMTKIQGLDIHFVHVKPKQSYSIPILLLHGWPASFREFLPVLDVLTDKTKNNEIEFEFVVADLPGYGWSSAASKPGLGPPQMAVIFKELMERLGHKQWYIQGGDWGSQVASYMGAMYPKEVVGIHLNLCFPRTRKTQIYYWLMSLWPSLFMEDRFVKKLYPVTSMIMNFTILEMGYFHLQATKPDTVGAGLADSPSGLAAYMLEKYSTATNVKYRDYEDGGLTERFTYDDLLDNVMIVWLTNSMTSSMRLYAENYIKENRELDLENVQIKVPTWCAKFPNDMGYYPDFLIRYRYPLLKGSTDFKEGGHYAPAEVPELLANDIILAIKSFEKDNPVFFKT